MPLSPRTLAIGGLAAVALAVAGFFLYGAKKKQDLESSALGSAAQATAYLREAAGFAVGAPRAVDALRAAGDDLERRLVGLRTEDRGRNRALADAAELYVIDAQAVLRNHAEASRALFASRASRRALSAHLRAAGGRGAGWIQTALALKSRAERDNFDARTAAQALEGLMKAHRDTQDKLRGRALGAAARGNPAQRAAEDRARGRGARGGRPAADPQPAGVLMAVWKRFWLLGSAIWVVVCLLNAFTIIAFSEGEAWKAWQPLALAAGVPAVLYAALWAYFRLRRK